MGAFLYFSDVSIQKIRRYSFSTGIVSSVIGTGGTGLGAENATGTSSAINSPYFIYGDSMGNIFYSDQTNHRIRKYSMTTTRIVTIVGTVGGPGFNVDNTTGTSVMLYSPAGLWGDSDGNTFLLTGISGVTSIYGDSMGGLYYSANHVVRKATSPTSIVTSVAGEGSTAEVQDLAEQEDYL
eukprot:gene8351-9034_t